MHVCPSLAYGVTENVSRAKETPLISTTPATTPIDPKKLEAAIHRFVDHAATAATAVCVVTGDKLGLYKALAHSGPLTSSELAQQTKTHERYVREWLANQAAAGYLQYDPASERFTMPPEHVPLLADDDSEVMMCGLFSMAQPLFADEPRITAAFSSGEGVGWDEHDSRLYTGTDRIFRNGYSAHLTKDWIPALEGVEAKLRTGATVADLGCGHGSSTLLMAHEFPMSQFVGFDYHEPSIEIARKRAREAGVAGRVRFEVADGKSFAESGFDLIACFDCVHDMGDPVGVLTHARKALMPNGTFMMVEPFANDRLEDNLNPIGQLFYAASTHLCTPASLKQEVGLALGAQAGEARMRDVATKAGFTHFRRAAETPFNIIYEARP
jgi:2-polyprenyl-3-methyl-5-hydroxy-6-metoxy-1,4-benzoquinol methylase